MSSSYSNAIYYDMIMCVGATDGNLAAARRLYFERYVDRTINPRTLPSSACFRGLVNRLHTTGSFHERNGEGRPMMNTEVEERVLEYFEENPTASTRRSGLILGVSHWKVWKTLKRDEQHPYHYRKTQELLPRDTQPRVQFARWYIDQLASDPSTAGSILWTDEASFTRTGVFNTHNAHYWAHENPRVSRESSFQHRWRINVWAGILGGRLLGPIFIPGSLNAQNYEMFLRHQLEDMLEDLPVALYARVIFQHDGAPAHYAASCRRYLDRRFDRWIGRGGSVAWPARSPDLTPLDFFLWGHVKNEVYAVECTTEEEMRAKIIEVMANIPQEMLQRAVTSVARRMELCITRGGRHIEPFL